MPDTECYPSSPYTAYNSFAGARCKHCGMPVYVEYKMVPALVGGASGKARCYRPCKKHPGQADRKTGDYWSSSSVAACPYSSCTSTTPWGPGDIEWGHFREAWDKYTG